MKINKKIALCISGQPRYIKKGYEGIYQNIIKNNNVDVFIHTWYDEEKVGQIFDFSPNNTYGRTGKLEHNTLDIIKELYNPKKLKYEKQKDFKTHSNVNYEKQTPISLYSMYYSIHESNQLKKDYEIENDLLYDVVIRCRFDILFNTFNLKFDGLDLNRIYVSGEIEPHPNDQFAMGSSENMDYYSSLFNKIDYYYNNGFRDFVNEKILKKHLNEGDINIYFSNHNEMLVNIIKE